MKHQYNHQLLWNFQNVLWIKDVNSATNIYRIAKNVILQKSRPKYLCRDKKEDNNESNNKKTKSTKEKVNKKTKSTKEKVNKSTKKKVSWGCRFNINQNLHSL